jgi:four helix bundle protein
MAKLPRYHSLIAWQRADDLFIRLHRVTREHFPADERYELTSQLRRAAFSVPANIVEGTARHHPRETLQFLRTSWASLVETGYCLHVARRLGYITDALFDELDLDLRKTAAPLLGMIRKRRSVSVRDDRRRLPRRSSS